MRRMGQTVLMLAVVALTASAVQAQQREGRGRGFGGFGGFGGNTLGLVTQKSVQEEIKLSDDQVAKVTKLQEDQRGSFGGLRDLPQEERGKKMREMGEASEKAVAEILNPEQLTRVKQISMQQRGLQAVNDPKVAEALALSEDQKKKIMDIQEDARKEMQGLFTAGAGGDNAAREQNREKFAAIRKSSEEKVKNVLTADQQTKLKEMQGEPFKGELRGFGGGGGRPPRGQGN